MARYRASAVRRAAARSDELRQREVRAWTVARQAAEVLRSRFGASRVVLFGSLVRPGAFTRWSDVDVAAWGLRPSETFAAVAAVLALDREVEVNLVDMGTCSPALAEAIDREGRPL
jgi:predicted nucleotidyltransferase